MGKFIAVILLLIGLGYGGYFACISCAEVKGTHLADVPCTPVLSNGKRNPHYLNMWDSCRSQCGFDQGPALDIKTCEWSCRRK